jgi:hypothetical protein
MQTDATSLEWVIVEGKPRHVSAFASLRRSERPIAACPECGRRVTLKLGAVRRHHAAHDPGAACAATNPETALHLNTKLALAAVLAAAASNDAVLSIVRSCCGAIGERCTETRIAPWLHGWDTVLIEHRIGPVRPDIVLERGGASVAGIEVLRSHAVDEQKRAALALLGVPWIELAANEELSKAGGWSVHHPLPVVRTNQADEWRCERHEALHATLLRSREEERTAAMETARHSTRLIAARVVDVYHALGGRERHIYRMEELSTDGTPHALRLNRGGREIVRIELSPAAQGAIHLAYNTDVAALMEREGSFADSPMDWATLANAENIVYEALTDRVGRDPTPLATRFPRRWFFDKTNARWFLPADTRHVRWDRPTDDAFAAHPAWTQRAVRERPMTEDAWPQPVFARPPHRTMFGQHFHRIYALGEVAVLELDALDDGAVRAIVVIEKRVSDDVVEQGAMRLAAENIDAIWISHPTHWTSALESLVWTPAGRDGRGGGFVVVDGVGTFRAEQFVRALVSGERRLQGTAIRASMAARVGRLRDQPR